MSSKYSIPDFVAHMNGKCDLCGEENADLYCIDGYMNLCRHCFENEVDICDECGQIWVSNEVEFTETDDGRMICEYCMEELEE